MWAYVLYVHLTVRTGLTGRSFPGVLIQIVGIFERLPFAIPLNKQDENGLHIGVDLAIWSGYDRLVPDED